MDEPRIARLERQVEELTRRVASLERPAGRSELTGSLAARQRLAEERVAGEQRATLPASASPPARARAPQAERVAPRPERVAPRPEGQALDPPGWRRPAAEPGPPLRERLGLAGDDGLEDLLGGRILAWVGGVAVLLGIVFLFAVAISRGWIGEAARTALAALGSGGLLVLGVWLHERRARADAALAAVATGVAGLFVTITVATQVYALVPSLVGTVLALIVGAIATALAVRWESRGIAALGILGALGAPVLAGAEYDGGTVTILFVALAAAGGVLVWQRWNWLALAAFAISAPQWIAYLFDGASPATAVATLVAFGLLGVVLAVGHDLRVAADQLRVQPAFLLALNAIALATAGWFALRGIGEASAGKAWLAGLAAVHVAVGLAGPRLTRVSQDLALLALVLGTVVADVAFALVADGVVLAVGWTLTSVGFAVLLRRVKLGGRTEALTGGGLGGHIALAILTALTVDDPPGVLAGNGALSAACAASFAALAAGCLVSARLADERRREWRLLLDATGLAAVAFLTALLLDGEALVLTWIGEVGALTAIAYRFRDQPAGWGALGFLALAGIHTLTLDAPLQTLTAGLDDPSGTLVPVAAVAAALLATARVLPGLLSEDEPLPLRLTLDAIGLSALAYLTALALGGELLVAALAGEALALAFISRRLGDAPSGWSALPFLVLAATHALAYEAPPVSLVTGLAEPLAAAVAVGAVAAAALVASELLSGLHTKLGPALKADAAVALLYLASALVVTPFESGNAVDSALLSAHQQGQMVLSVFWALVGVGTLVVGLRRDLYVLRLAALGLLGLTVVKVFLFDLATLTSVYRVVSFIGLGLLLLVGAYVWQRMRPRRLPDLRETPAGLR
jgi:uncharacterized membrane protein